MPVRKTIKKVVVKKESSKRLPVRKTTMKSIKSENAASIGVTPYLKNTRLWVGVGVVAVLVLLFIFKGLFVVALVNGQPITRLSVLNQLEKQDGKQVVSDLIVQNLIMQEAAKKNIQVKQSDIDSEIATIENQLKGQGTTLDAALAARGLTKSDLTNQIKMQKVLDMLVGPVKVSDAEVASYIDKNKDSLPQGLSDTDLQNQVRLQLQQQTLQTKEQSFIADLQKKANITYFVNY